MSLIPGPDADSECWSITLYRGRRRPGSLQQVSDREHVLVVGHPYVDVWQSIKPDRLGVGRMAGDPPRH